MRINGIVNDSIVDGPGLRLAVFTQGCIHNCEDCHNPQTHDFNGGYDMSVDEIMNKFLENPLLSGITLTGGDPLEQPAECLEIAKRVKKLNKSVWVYTGYTIEELYDKNDEVINELLNNIDVLVDGEFVKAEKSLELKFKGSKNQRLIDMNKSSKDNIVLWKDPYEFEF